MPAVSTAEKAGWATRALAIIIDAIGIIAAIVSSILGGDPTSTRNQGLATLFHAVYFTYFWSTAGKGQTLGSRALNIRVVIWAAFDAQKQGWHDKIAGTYVVKA